MNVLCMALGLVLLVLASVLDIQIKKYLKLRILVGIPELSAGDENPKLLTEGIYARTRNPRYLAVCITVCGWALMTNFLAMYVLCPILFGLVWIVVLLEEKELRNRFGEAYEEYLRKVPRFIPNF
jgi:protein-S-isoprenylcysteine O-methyltransferase Ste14